MIKKGTISAVMKELSKKAAKARKNIPPEQRIAIAKKAAAARWKKKPQS